VAASYLPHEPDRGPPPIYDSARRPPPFWEELVQAWSYRDLVVQLVARDIKVRYKRSVLGVAWSMLNPLMMMVVLTLVFSHVFRSDLSHYPVYLLAGTVLWSFFTQGTTEAMNQLLWGQSLLTKIYLPRTAFAIASIGTGLVNLGLSLIPLLAIMLVTGVPLSLSLLWLPVPILLTAMFVLGAGLLLSALALSFRDVSYMYQIVLTAWYFLTPILYPKTIVPESERWWFNLNPMYHLVETFRAPIYAGSLPEFHTLLVAALVSLGMLILGWWVFTARADEIAYRL
jgi:ABC-type polysaccharide/polyol phosphate export permease